MVYVTGPGVGVAALVCCWQFNFKCLLWLSIAGHFFERVGLLAVMVDDAVILVKCKTFMYSEKGSWL